jgi:heme exporter protein B
LQHLVTSKLYMTLFTEITFLLKKETLLELRQKYALGGILLYVASTVFVVKLSFLKTAPEVWNALFWIISLFASLNAVVKSFVQENSAAFLLSISQSYGNYFI